MRYVARGEGVLWGESNTNTPRLASVIDLGAGGGHYAAHFNKTGLISARAFDAPVNLLTIEKTQADLADELGRFTYPTSVAYLDAGKALLSAPSASALSTPTSAFPRSDLVFCIEVAEHVEASQLEVFLANLDYLGRRGMVLSWASEKCGLGWGHVNCLEHVEREAGSPKFGTPYASVQELIEEKTGYVLDVKETERLRAASEISWIQNSVSFFVKKDHASSNDDAAAWARYLQRVQSAEAKARANTSLQVQQAEQKEKEKRLRFSNDFLTSGAIIGAVPAKEDLARPEHRYHASQSRTQPLASSGLQNVNPPLSSNPADPHGGPASSRSLPDTAAFPAQLAGAPVNLQKLAAGAGGSPAPVAPPRPPPVYVNAKSGEGGGHVDGGQPAAPPVVPQLQLQGLGQQQHGGGLGGLGGLNLQQQTPPPPTLANPTPVPTPSPTAPSSGSSVNTAKKPTPTAEIREQVASSKSKVDLALQGLRLRAAEKREKLIETKAREANKMSEMYLMQTDQASGQPRWRQVLKQMPSPGDVGVLK